MLGPQFRLTQGLTFITRVRMHHRNGEEGNTPMRRADVCNLGEKLANCSHCRIRIVLVPRREYPSTTLAQLEHHVGNLSAGRRINVGFDPRFGDRGQRAREGFLAQNKNLRCKVACIASLSSTMVVDPDVRTSRWGLRSIFSIGLTSL